MSRSGGRCGSALVAAAVALVALAAGCTTSGDGAATPSPTASAGSPASDSELTAAPSSPDESASTTTPSVPQAPPEGGCYRLAFTELTEPSSGSRPVPCAQRHDAQTIHVGRLDTYVDGHALAVDSDRVLAQLSRTCPRRLARYVGGSAEDRHLSRLEVVWFVPTLEQSDRGADWFRCDVVALAGDETLAALPRPARLRGLLDGTGGSAYGLCGTSAPGAPGFERVLCGRRHSWRAIATIPLDGNRYPGVRAVRSAGDDACRDRVRATAPDPLTFRYGWEWPTREQWGRGQHFGYCWAPEPA